MARIEEAELKRHLAQGAFASLYVLAGEEKYLVKRAARQLIDKAGGSLFPEFNRNELDGACTIDSLADAVEALPFMAEHKCVAVQDLDLWDRSQGELDKLDQLLENLPGTTTLVLWFPTAGTGGKAASRWQSFLRKAEKYGCVLLCARRTEGELKRLLAKEAGKAGCSFPSQGVQRLLDYAGQDLNRLLGEVEKLCAYALGTGQPSITPAMVEKLVAKSTEVTVFLMVDALVAGSYEKAYSLLDSLFYQREDPIAIIGALAASYVDMYRVRAALDSGLPASAPTEYGDYKGKEFRLRRAERNLRRLPGPVLHKSLSLLLEADLALKGSRLEPRVVMDGLIARLLLAASPEADR